jgi:hypothetical protein
VSGSRFHEPYVRWNHNRFGDSRIVIPCACGAGQDAGEDDDNLLQPPHKADCPVTKRAHGREGERAPADPLTAELAESLRQSLKGRRR